MAQRYYPLDPRIIYDDNSIGSDTQEADTSTSIDDVFEEVREQYDQVADDDITILEEQCTGNLQSIDVEETDDNAAKISKAIEQLGESSKKGEKSCGACAKPRRVLLVSEFIKGQHISMPGRKSTKYNKQKRTLKNAYTHHAIVKAINNTEGSAVEMVLIHFTQTEKKGEIKVYETTEKYDLTENEIYIVDYIHPKYDSETIIRRAESVLGTESAEFKSYNLITKNCEHFATWCVVGDGESFQVQDIREQIASGIHKVFGTGSKIAKGIMRLLFISADELVSGLGKAAPDIATGITGGLYLIYCIFMTVLHVRDYNSGKLCKSCMKGKILDLWLSFGAFGLTSALTFIILQFALPLLAPGIGIPLMILLILLSLAFQYSVPKIRRALQGPFMVDKTTVTDISQLKVGDVVTFRFGPTKIVTDVKFDNNTPLKGVIRVVHYSTQSFFQKRIIEEDIVVDLAKKSLHVLDCTNLKTYSPDNVVSRIRSRVGETKWTMLSNRSDHLCYWAKVYNRWDSIEDEMQDSSLVKSQSKNFSSLLVEEKEAYLIEEIKIGDAIVSSKIGFFRDTGIVVAMRYLDTDNDRKIHIDVCVYEFSGFVRKQSIEIDLNEDHIYVKKYHPAQCHTMDERARNAKKLINKAGTWWTSTGFIEHCIMINPD